MKKTKMIFIAFAVTGIILLIVQIPIIKFLIVSDNDVKTTGIITEINFQRRGRESTSYVVVVEYEVDGETYKSELNEYSSGYYEGKEIDIYYRSDDPYKIRSNVGSTVVIAVFSALGLIFALVGFIGVKCLSTGNNKLEKLKSTGELIDADYVGVEVNTILAVNGRHPFKIICAWINPTDGNKYFFKSENIWENPEYIINEKAIRSFPVYVSRDSFKKYSIDISSIKEQ